MTAMLIYSPSVPDDWANMQIDFPGPRRLLRVLLMSALVLQVLSLGGHFLYHYLGYHNVLPRFGLITSFLNVDKEKNLPTWFSSAVLLAAAYVVWAIHRTVRRLGGRYVWHWGGLCLVFGFLSMDETAEFHEMASEVGLVHAGTASYLSWIVVASPFVLAFVVSYFRFLLHLPVPSRTLVIWSGLLYIGGAVGMEIMGALLGRDLTIQLAPGKPYFHYLLFASAEEAMEMVGAILFLYAMTLHLANLRTADAALRATPAQARAQHTAQPATV